MRKIICIIFLPCFLLISAVVYSQDSIKINSSSFDSSLFANDDTLTVNDYLSSIRKSIQTLNKVSIIRESYPALVSINDKIDDDDSALNLIQKRLSRTERIVNLRNAQMFYTLLNRINSDTKNYNNKLNILDSQLDAVKSEIFKLRIDTFSNHLFRHKALLTVLRPQILQLYLKWKNADSVIKKTNHLIDNTLARTSANLISTGELLTQAKAILQSTSYKAFTKESRYLWEPVDSKTLKRNINSRNSIEEEKKIIKYYFKDSITQLYLLFAFGILFFYWIFYNLKSVKKINKSESFDFLKLKYVNKHPLFTSLIIVLSIAPLFDLNAPSIYIELIIFFLILTLTIHFWTNMPKVLFRYWGVFIIISLLLIFMRLFGLSYVSQRNSIFFLDLSMLILGGSVAYKFKSYYSRFRVLFLTGFLFLTLTFLAIIANLFGRITLMNMFSLTSIFALIQCIGLVIFIEATKEAFLLQIQSSRIRQGYPEHFEFKDISKQVTSLVTGLAILIWIIVFSTNINLYNGLYSSLISGLSQIRQVGSFSFSFSGILLFVFILWFANFLQKYIAYFFGDTGEEAAFENVGQRSKLLITRLILLVTGFLIAVVASGLPIDRITVILGALGVGIGLGLQSIVNNFVSGIILIFDRPMRIGDTVEIGDKKGRVKEISVRASTLLTNEGAEVIMPNGTILNSNIVNWTLSNSHIRAELNFSIDKINDHTVFEKSVVDLIKLTPNTLAQKNPEVIIGNISSTSTQLKIYFWCKDVTRIELTKSLVYQQVYKLLEETGSRII